MKLKLYGVESDPLTIKATEFLRNNKLKFEFVKLQISQPKVIEDLHGRSGKIGVPQLCMIADDNSESFILGFKEEEYKVLLKNDIL